jgi:prepilin-type N-terminal cleavage/methylation domain-containing protein
MKNHRKQYRKRFLGPIHGFTLIELLVVIAIISLLVSILLPSLRQAVALAKRTVCSSNLHQIGIALQFYAEDNNGAFPPWHVKSSGAMPEWSHLQGCSFMQILMGCYGGCTPYLPYSSDGKIPENLQCPTETEGPRWAPSYGLNKWRFNLVWTTFFEREVWLTTEIMGMASDRVMGFCHANYNGAGRPPYPGEAPVAEVEWNDRHIDVHDGGYPILWFDLHCSFVFEGDELMQSESFYSSW